MTHPASAESFEEIEARLEADKKPDGTAAGEALKAKLEGDAVPEPFRGKTVEEILKVVEASQSALAISEKARKEAEDRVRAAPAPAAPATPAAPAPEPEFTEDDFKTLYEESPAKAFMKLQEQTERRLSRNFEQRFTPLVTSAASAAEQHARAQRPEDFEIFGDQIEGFIQNQLGGDRGRVSTVNAWNDLLSYIRGQPQNVEKLFEYRKTKGDAEAKRQAEERQAAAAGFSGTAGARRAPPEAGGAGGDNQLDDTERAIAAEFVRSGVVKDEAEYVRWKGATK